MQSTRYPGNAIAFSKLGLAVAGSVAVLANPAWAAGEESIVLPAVTSVATTPGENTSSSASTAYNSPLSSTRTTTTITSQAVQAMTPTGDFAQSLANIPNLNVIPSGTNGIDGSSIYMRGMDQSLINFTVDGIPINSPNGYNFYSNENLPPQFISHIDVNPGAGSAATVGNANFAGSVAIYSKTPAEHFSVSPFYGYGSFGTQSYGGLINSGLLFANSIPTKLYVGATATRSHGYYENTQSHKYTFIFKSESLIGPGKLTLFFFQNNQFWNFYNGATPEQLAQFGRRYSGNSANPESIDYYGYNFKNFLNWQAYGKYSVKLGRLDLSNQYYYFYGKGGGNFAQASSAAPGGFYLAKRIFPQYEYGDILRAKYHLEHAELEGGFWVDVDRETAFQRESNLYDRYTGALVSAPVNQPVITHSFQPYLQAKWQIVPRLDVQAGVKLMNLYRTWANYVSKQERSANFNRWLPSFSANYGITPDVHVYFNYTRSAQAPSASQLTAQYFNQGLQPEIANSFELGSYWHEGVWGGRITAFRTNFENYIVSAPIVIGNQVFSTQSNAGAAVFQGLELSNTVQLNSWLSAFLNVGLLDAQMQSGAPTIQAPHHNEALGLSWKNQHWQGMLAVQQVGSRFYAVGGSDTARLGNYVTGTLNVSYNTGKVQLWQGYDVQNIQFSVFVNNLFNQDYYYNASLGRDGSTSYYPIQPINAFAQISATF